jgi:hypothetical protein
MYGKHLREPGRRTSNSALRVWIDPWCIAKPLREPRLVLGDAKCHRDQKKACPTLLMELPALTVPMEDLWRYPLQQPTAIFRAPRG